MPFAWEWAFKAEQVYNYCSGPEDLPVFLFSVVKIRRLLNNKSTEIQSGSHRDNWNALLFWYYIVLLSQAAGIGYCVLLSHWAIILG